MMQADRVLVTGATGFFGAHILAAFISMGWSVIAGVRHNSDTWRLAQILKTGTFPETVQLDLHNPASIKMGLEVARPHVLVHCASYGVDYQQQDPDIVIAVNVAVLPQLLAIAADVGVERVIHIGTGYEYGSYNNKVSETNTTLPRGIYASSKAAATVVALERAGSLNLPLVVIRPFTMIGELDGQYKLVPQIIHACLDRKPLELTAGEQVRDFLYVGDAAEVCTQLASIKPFPAGEIFNIGSGCPTTVRDLGNLIADHIGHGQNWLHWGARQYRSDETMYMVADISKAEQILGWQASTSLDLSISKALASDSSTVGLEK